MGELNRPMHIDIHDGKLYVAEYLNDRIQVFSMRGESISVIGSPGSGPGEFDAPAGVVVDAEGRLYVADFYNHRVQILERNGRFIQQIGSTGVKGFRLGKFNYPTDVSLLPDGKLVVADAYNDRVQIFNADGYFIRKRGGPFASNISGSYNGWFKTATAVHVGPEGNIFVADFFNNRIQKFTPKGVFLVAFGEKGAGPGQFDRPIDMAVDESGNIYVVDFGNNRIQKFTTQLKTLD